MISAILTIYGNAPERSVNFIELCACIRRQKYTDYELIIVEQTCGGHPLWEGFANLIGASYKRIECPQFCWEWERNVGARMARGDILIFFDADAIFPDSYFTFVEQNFTWDFALGWDKLIYLSANGKATYLEERRFKTDWATEEVEKVGAPYGSGWGTSVVLKKDFYWNKLGGYSENYWGKGRGDRGMQVRATAITGQDNYLPCTVIHLYHDARFIQPDLVDTVFAVTHKYPLQVSNRLVDMKLGDPAGRKQMDFEGIESEDISRYRRT